MPAPAFSSAPPRFTPVIQMDAPSESFLREMKLKERQILAVEQIGNEGRLKPSVVVTDKGCDLGYNASENLIRIKTWPQVRKSTIFGSYHRVVTGVLHEMGPFNLREIPSDPKKPGG